MEARFPTQDTVRAALIALLQAKGYELPGDCVHVSLLTSAQPPAYRVTPTCHAATVLAIELSSITGRSLELEQSWVLLQGDVNLLFGAVRQHVSAQESPAH